MDIIGLALTPDEIHDAAARLETAPPEDVLAWALQTFGTGVSLASSFGAEDMCLVDMLCGLTDHPRVFYLDTGLLFQETYALIEATRHRYGFDPIRLTPLLTVEEQAETLGPELWLRAPDRCCGIRKVEPLTHFLSTERAWVTGIRRKQTPARQNARVVEADAKFGLVKLNPLARWTHQDVWRYIHAHGVSYNPLHDQGYPSIGCWPCTSQVLPGQDPRSGRWKNFDKTECGLHE
ncbi:MAG: phosphoadenylyl-sulfate reductase [Clostridia bacterium]